MLKIGDYNRLAVVKNVDFGVYLDGGEEGEILLPARYVPDGLSVGDEIEVFIYRDSEGRLIATTEKPYARVGQFVFLQVTDVNDSGAFLDWGIPTKELMLPYKEQTFRLTRGMVIPVYVYLDDQTRRIVASAKIDRFIGNVFPDDLRPGDKVRALVLKHTEIGYRAVVNDLYAGMLYEDQVAQPVEIGVEIDAWVHRIREDGKLDLGLTPTGDARAISVAKLILDTLQSSPEGFMALTDASAPELIKDTLGCSKKDFKKAIGHLYRDHKIIIREDGIKLNQ